VALGERPRRREGQEGWCGATGLARRDEARRVVFQVIWRTSPAAGQRLRLAALPVPTPGDPLAGPAGRGHRALPPPAHQRKVPFRAANGKGSGALARGASSPSTPWYGGWVARRRCARVRGNRCHPCRWALACRRDHSWFGPWQRGDLRCGDAGAAGRGKGRCARTETCTAWIRLHHPRGDPSPQGRSAPTHAGAARGQLRPGHPAFPVPACADSGHGQLRPTGPG